MSSDIIRREFGDQSHINAQAADFASERRWYAVFTLPRNEKSAMKHLELRDIESFLPTYDAIRVWKNRQCVKAILPLFPTYLFVRINRWERVKVLQSPGVLHIVGNGRESVPLRDAEVEFLKAGFCGRKPEPYKRLVFGEKVRIKSGVMQGIEGVLVRKNRNLRFVLTLNLINQHAAVEVDGDSLEPVLPEG